MFRLSSSSASSSASASSSSSGKAINRRISIIIDIIIIIIIVFPRWWCGMNEFWPHFQIWASAAAAATTTETGDSKSIPFKSIAGIAKFRETQSAKTTWFLMTNERHGRWMVAPESRLDPVAGQMLLTGLRDDARSQVLADQSGDTFWSDQSRFIDHVIVFQIPNVYNGSLSGTMMYVDTYDGRPPQNRSTRLRWLTRDCGMQNTLGGDTMVAPLSSYDTYVNSDKPFELWIVNHLSTETGTRMMLTQNSVAFSISADNRVMNIKRFHRIDSIFYTLCEYDDEKISFARNSTACESGGQALDWPIYTGFVANRMWMLFGSDAVYLFDQALIENGQIGKYRYRNFVDFFFNPGFITASTATFRPSTSSISNSSAVTPYSPNRNNTTATGPTSASEIGAHSLEIIIATVVIIITIAILCGLWMAFGRHFGSQQQPQQQPLEDGAGPALGPDQAPAPQEDNNENVTNEAIEVENGGEAGEEANPDDEQQQQQQQEYEEPPQPEQQGASGSTSAAAAGSASVKTATKKVKQNLPRSPRNTLKALQDILARKSRLNPTLKAGGATGRSSKKAKKSAQMANGDRNGSGDPKPAHSGLSNPSEVLPPSLDRVPESLVRSIKTENCSKSRKKSAKPVATTTTTGSKKLSATAHAQQMPRSPSRKNSSSKSEAVAAGGGAAAGGAHGKKSTKISRKMNQKLSKKRSKASARSSTTTSATSTAATSKPSSARKAKSVKAKSVKANVKSKPKSIIPLNKTSKKSKKSTKFSNNNNKSIQNKTKMKLKSSKNHQQPPHQVDVNNKQKSGKPKPKSKPKSRSKPKPKSKSKPKPNSKPKSISKPKPKTIKNSNKQQQQAKSSRKKGTKSSKR